MNIEAKLKKDRSGLLPIDYMFSGFQCLNLVRKNFEFFNGFRITMRKPSFPCKLGVHINTGISEFEHFVGHLADIDDSSNKDWVSYEIPISLMVNNYIKSSLIHCHADDNFLCRGVTFHVEKTHSQFDPNKDLDENGDPVPISF